MLSNIVGVTVTLVALLLIVNYLIPQATGAFALITAALGAGLGFGAQNVVKDVLNGLFIVAEDQLGVGDVVDTGFATGVVEWVDIRTTQIRDVNGTLWYVRNGEIIRVGNMSQGWARVIIDLAVPYETDVDAVQDRILRDRGRHGRQHEVEVAHHREARGVGHRVGLRRGGRAAAGREDDHGGEGRRGSRAASTGQAHTGRDGREAPIAELGGAHRVAGGIECARCTAPSDQTRADAEGSQVTEHIQLRSGEGGDAVPIGGGQGNFWREVGGRPTFEKLVRKFYEGVEHDEVLRPMYPDDDMEGAVQRLTGFLEQYWGGPGTS